MTTLTRPRVTIDDFLIVAFLLLTIWHTAHILAGFEMIGELAWPLAIGIDVGVARAAWVVSGKHSRGARVIAGIWLAYLLGASFGLNWAYYYQRNAGDWSPALASLFPISLALAGAVKALLDTRGEQRAQVIEERDQRAPNAIISAPADGGSARHEDGEREVLNALLETEREERAKLEQERAELLRERGILNQAVNEALVNAPSLPEFPENKIEEAIRLAQGSKIKRFEAVQVIKDLWISAPESALK